MKKLIAVVAVLVAIMAATAGSATADPSGNESCNGAVWLDNNYSFDTQATNVWDVWESHFCAPNTTLTWEIQHTTNGGATVSDWLEYGYRATGNGQAEHSVIGSCAWTGSYRYGFNWNGGGHVRGDWIGAGKVCAGAFNTH